MANGNMAGFGAGAAMTRDGFAAAPPAQPTLVLAPASDSGTTEDDITNDTTPTLNGVAVAGSTVTIYDGAARWPRLRPPETGPGASPCRRSPSARTP